MTDPVSIVIDGILAGPLSALRSMLARSVHFQTWIGAADATTAFERIHLLETTPDPVLPLALIDLGDGFERERVTLTAGRPFVQRGSLTLYLQEQVAAGITEADAILGFCARLGQVWADLEATSGEPGLLLITGISVVVAPIRSTSERRDLAGDTIEAALAITWQATH